MSEYQYFDFLALDSRLTARQMTELRLMSSRADISRRRFTNSYTFGNPRFDPVHLVDRYFDASLTLTNWGDRGVQLAVPVTSLPLEETAAYCSDDVVTARTAGARTVVSVQISSDDLGAADSDLDDVWDPERSEGYGEEGWYDDDDGDGTGDSEDDEAWSSDDGTLDLIAPAQVRLAGGDRSVLYLAWLVAVARGDVEDDVIEPPLPRGLSHISDDLQTFADFLLLPPTLVEAAAGRRGDGARTAGQLLVAEALLT